jgi:uncharacterized membrane protein
MKRLVYLDMLRGIAILLMVVDHAYDWWLDAAGQSSTLGSVHRVLGALAAPLFIALVGMGLALSGQRSERAGQARHAVARRLLRRGGTLILWGYALNLLVFYTGQNPADIWAVDVLHTIGLCIWFSIPLLWAPPLVVAVCALLVAALGQTAGQRALPVWLAAYLTGTGGIGYFPLALWLPYCYTGLVMGKWIGETRRPGRLMAVLAAAGLLALLAAALMPPAWGYRHPRPAFTAFALAVLLWLTSGLWFCTGQRGTAGPLARALRDLGVSSLLLYAFHHLVGYRLLWLLGWVKGRSWRGEYGVLGPVQATILLAGLVGLMLVVARLRLRWQRSQAGSAVAPAPGAR